MVQTLGGKLLRLTMYFFLIFHSGCITLTLNCLCWRVVHYEREAISIYCYMLSLKCCLCCLLQNRIKTNWQPFEVTEYTSSFISVWTHQKKGLWWQIDSLIQFDRKNWQPCHLYLRTTCVLVKPRAMLCSFLSRLILAVVAAIAWYFLKWQTQFTVGQH